MYSMDLESCNYKTMILMKVNSKMGDSMEKENINGLMLHVSSMKVNFQMESFME